MSARGVGVIALVSSMSIGLLAASCASDARRSNSSTVAISTTIETTTTPTTAPTTTSTTNVSGSIVPLTPGTSWQWQLGGDTIDETVLDAVANPKKTYDIDLFTVDSATVARLHGKGITVVCYMETGGWEADRPDAAQYPSTVLGNVVEGYPGERFVDIRQTDVLLPVLTARLDLAVSKGCDGVEPDLDDTYDGYDTGFPLTRDDQLTFNRAVAAAAHARGLSIGLKNGASDDGSFEAEMADVTDWALNEECNTYDECAGYLVYIAQNKAVFQVEYMSPNGTRIEDFCGADNAADFDGLLKDSSDSLDALPRVACRLG